MLVLQKSCFFHVPKTGGTWVTKAIKASGIRCLDCRVDGNPHLGLQFYSCPDRFRFAFVRHPVALYRSYWQFKMTYGWDPLNGLDMECQSDRFAVFIRNVLDRYPGAYSQGLIDYVGEPDAEIEFVGKYENLVEDLITALQSAGEEFDENVIRALAPVNVSDKTRFPAEYTQQLEKEVRKSESMVIERFGYE